MPTSFKKKHTWKFNFASSLLEIRNNEGSGHWLLICRALGSRLIQSRSGSSISSESGSSISSESGSGSNRDPGFWWPKTEEKNTAENFKNLFFGPKTVYLLSYVQATREAFSHQKITASTSTNFSMFVGHFCPPGSGFGIANPYPDTDPGTPLNHDPDPDTGPDPQHCLSVCIKELISCLAGAACWRVSLARSPAPAWGRPPRQPPACTIGISDFDKIS